ncbi:GNAT family N-acetyltransferase [Fusibacter paucivorans]|uniref:GNAT family N-acetyltransferase n=1 Tax=Fusibacter paucivorans TaxID=76009 RepID=A0ABS5PTL0_9FIRM|nr:GNAT family N-acetyltransferase [Fusibacter paucivorans]MBS7528423.1 GNAT family N-acetyltransferase [Fusibacter paucivorans]
MTTFIQLNTENIEREHICCAFSDKKCTDGYAQKKQWLKSEFENGYVFYHLDERAKVFIEYGPIEKAWLPIEGENFLNINCFWVSGKYKKQGYAKQLLQKAIDDAVSSGKSGLVTVVGKKKYHFMSEGKWFLKNGFEIVDETESGFVLLMKPLQTVDQLPQFKPQVKTNIAAETTDFSVYYSDRCPFTKYHVETVLKETLSDKSFSCSFHHLTTLEAAQASPTPATIFSLFYKGKFLTTDLSVCSQSKFEKLCEQQGIR